MHMFDSIFDFLKRRWSQRLTAWQQDVADSLQQVAENNGWELVTDQREVAKWLGALQQSAREQPRDEQESEEAQPEAEPFRITWR